MFEIKKLSTKNDAQRIIDFLCSENAFQQTWTPGEKEMVRKAVLASIEENKRHQYWFIEEQGLIVGAIGVKENIYKSGGYEMAEDYMSVHKDYRKKGLGTKLLKTMEDFVRVQNGRYILIETCDIDSYKPARLFYEKNGYVKVSFIPDYFVPGEGKIDYLKRLTPISN